MLVRSNESFALFIIFLEKIIYTLQRFCLQLIDDIVKNLQASNVDHTIVVWRVWDLDTEAKYSDEDRGQVWRGNELVVSLEEACFRGHFFEHSVHHLDESTNNVYLMHDAPYKRVLPSKVQLVLFQRVVQGQDIGVKGDHLLVNDVIKLVDANRDDL